jgi:hypothetical protein
MTNTGAASLQWRQIRKAQMSAIPVALGTVGTANTAAARGCRSCQRSVNALVPNDTSGSASAATAAAVTATAGAGSCAIYDTRALLAAGITGATGMYLSSPG